MRNPLDARGTLIELGDMVMHTPALPGNAFRTEAGIVHSVFPDHWKAYRYKAKVRWPRPVQMDYRGFTYSTCFTDNLTIVNKAPLGCVEEWTLPESLPKCLCGEPIPDAATWCLNCGASQPEVHERYGMRKSEYDQWLRYVHVNPGVRLKREVWLARNRRFMAENDMYTPEEGMRATHV